ncbi:PD-(D/E)XK motif protein [Colwellia sp. 6_MG-2023]|uniref:PD-(D/E)XK motif protein n=1 Tax=Colwellia sp. 6_MG-2023 TaxID=3062676 RepID=UPI0026E182FA|nr:PD-(D/E)XK motif protein [Colwellia sp. 6_MG-2023]MDO6486162.1 PD-(D/E)XK motif protein [Colwellia sp. 6_MG-2023]
MNPELLKGKWGQLTAVKTIKGYKSIRITSDCVSDIYLGINETGCHSLILNLPKNHQVNFKSVKKEKVTIELFPDTNYLIMTLLDEEYNNLFDDLIISLFNSIKDIKEVDLYSKVFIQTFYQWVLFFTLDNNDRLSKDIIKGVWGELFVLKELIYGSDRYTINDILFGWRGPYDQGHDFIYDDNHIEVKTKDINKVSVRISSEHQLEVEFGKKLTLTVVSVGEDMESGYSLRDLVLEIKKTVFDRLGDFSIILKALLQKGITLQNIQEYNNYRFKPLNIHDYDCLEEGFPKITTTELSQSISNVKYDLNLTNLANYVILIREF